MKHTRVTITAIGCFLFAGVLFARGQLSIGDKKNFMLEDDIQRAKNRAHNQVACTDREVIVFTKYSEAQLGVLNTAIGKPNISGSITPVGMNGGEGNQIRIDSGTNAIVDVEIPWNSSVSSVVVITEAEGYIRSSPDQLIINRVQAVDHFDRRMAEGEATNDAPSIVRVRVPSGSVRNITTVSDADRLEVVAPSSVSRSVSVADRVVSLKNRFGQGSDGVSLNERRQP